MNHSSSSLRRALLGVLLAALFLLSLGAAQAAAPLVAQDPERPAPPRQADAPPDTYSPTAIQPVTDPAALAAVLDIPAKDVISIILGNSDTRAFGQGQSTLGYHFPLAGPDFLIMSTGQAAHAETANNSSNLSTQLAGLNNQQGNDLVQMALKLRVPAGVNCASFDFAFYSEEFPEYVGSKFNDAFTAEFGGTNLSIVGSNIVAPLNFAFDVNGNLITINTVSGVTAPTNSTYDGKTPLRRAQVGVKPNEIIDIVLSIQDLGDSVYDSAVFLDRFIWSNNASCGGFVEPLPQPISTLQLHMLPALPTGANIAPKATVGNLSQAPTTYTLVLELRQGFGLLDTLSYPLTLQPGQIYQQQANFGPRPPGGYAIRARLLQGTEMVETTAQGFTIGEDYLNLKDEMDDLSKSAHQELNDGRDIAVEVFAKTLFEGGKTAVAEALTRFTGVLAQMDDSLPSEVVDEVANSAYEWFLEFGGIAEEVTGDLVEPHLRSWLDGKSYTARHSEVTADAKELIDKAEDQPFTWLDSWDSDVAHYREIIESQNETTAVGYGIDLDIKWPFYHRVTLTESKGQFLFFTDTLMPIVEKLFMIFLVGLIVVAVVAFILAVVGTGGVAAAASGLIATTIPSVWASFKAASLTKTVVAITITVLLAMLTGLTATQKTAVCVVDEHAGAMDDFAQRIDLSAGVRRPDSLLGARVVVDGYSIRFEGGELERAADIAPVYAQLYRGDGQLLTFNRLSDADGMCDTTTQRAAPGTYWAVITSADARGRTSTRQLVEVTAPSVALTLTVDDPQLVPGEKITARAQVTNLDTAQATGLITLAVRALPIETMELRQINLGAGQSQEFTAQFLPQETGGYVVQAHVSDGEFLLAAAEQGAVVGSGPAVSLNVAPQDEYAPGSDVAWNGALANSGNQAATTTLEVNTFERSTYIAAHTYQTTVTLGPGEQQSPNLPILPAAAPGVYTSYILLDGVPRFTHHFLVTADGALFATVEATPQFTDVGETVMIIAEAQDESYAPVDATLEAWVTTPAGNTVPVAMQSIGTGVFMGSYAPGTAGTYPVRIAASKPDYPTATANTYIVAEDASVLVADMTEQLVLSQLTAIELAVENEAGVPIPGATVVLSSTLGIQVENTGDDGVAAFMVNPQDENAVGVSVEKAGFAQTKLSLPIAVAPDNIPPGAGWHAPALTNQPTLAVSGKTEPGATVTIQNKPATVWPDGSFTALLQLKEGGNQVTGTASDAAGNQTPLAATITLDTIPPTLSVNWPSVDPDEWAQIVEITGQTEPGAMVTIRGNSVTASSNGQFSVWVPPDSASMLAATATDKAGNKMSRYHGTAFLFFPGVLEIEPPPPTTTPLLNGNFEQGRNVGWQEQSSNGFALIYDGFDPNVLIPHSGVWLAWLGGVFNDTSTLSQSATVPAAAPVLSFYHLAASADSCGHDFMRVRVGGQVFIEQSLCDATDTNGWARRTINLSSLAGQTVLIEFTVTTNGTLNSNLFIDDVAFAAAARQADDDPPAGDRPDGALSAAMKER